MLKKRKTLTTLLIWLALQFLCMIPAFLIIFPIAKATDMSMEERGTYMTLITLILAQLLSLLIFRLLKYFRLSETVKPVPKAKTLIMSVAGGISLFYAINIIQAQFDIPDLLEQQMEGLLSSVWGFIAICILAPLSEEVMMRRIILKDMWRKTGKMWGGILISSAIFAIIHLNPAQVVFAFPAAIILGWLYAVTGSLSVPILVHMANNSIAFFTSQTDADDPVLSDPKTIAVLAATLAAGLILMWLIAKEKRKADLLSGQEAEITESEEVREEL